ncbi:MAG: sensor histidine kinase, partial [Solirubrobacteraceae bacterium]
DVDVDLAFEAGQQKDRLDPELETGIYRIVQEALTNAVKHGDAQRAAVELVEHEHTLRVSVRDDGTGFEPTAATNGFGLAGMRERVELLGGELTIESAPGSGTTIAVLLPAVHRDQESPEAPLFQVSG